MKKINEIVIYLYVFFLIMSNYSIHFIQHSVIIYLGILVTSVLICTQCKGCVFNPKDMVKELSAIAIFAVLIFFGKDYGDKTFLMITGVFVLAYLVIKIVSQKFGVCYLLKAFTQIMVLITCISIVGYVFGTLLKVIHPIETIPSSVLNWSSWYGYNNYGYVYYDGQYTQIMGFNLLRNIGVFAEGPLFATLLTEAIYCNLFLMEKNKVHTAILFIGALTTFSSTVIAVGSILIFIDFYQNHLRHKKMIVIAPILAVFSLWIAGMFLYDKLFSGNISGNIRLDDIGACFKSWKASPLIGNGFKNIDVLARYRASWRGNEAGLSCGIGGVLSDGGIILGGIYIVPFIVACTRFLKSKNKKILGFIILHFVILFIMISHYTAYGMVLMAFSWVCIDEKFVSKNSFVQVKTRSIGKRRMRVRFIVRGR